MIVNRLIKCSWKCLMEIDKALNKSWTMISLPKMTLSQGIYISFLDSPTILKSCSNFIWSSFPPLSSRSFRSWILNALRKNFRNVIVLEAFANGKRRGRKPKGSVYRRRDATPESRVDLYSPLRPGRFQAPLPNDLSILYARSTYNKEPRKKGRFVDSGWEKKNLFWPSPEEINGLEALGLAWKLVKRSVVTINLITQFCDRIWAKMLMLMTKASHFLVYL